MCIVDVQPEVRVTLQRTSCLMFIQRMHCHNMSQWVTTSARSSTLLSTWVGRGRQSCQARSLSCWLCFFPAPSWPLFSLFDVNLPLLQALKRLRTSEFKPYVIFVKPRVPESRRRRSAATSPGGGEHGRVTVRHVSLSSNRRPVKSLFKCSWACHAFFCLIDQKYFTILINSQALQIRSNLIILMYYRMSLLEH